MSNILKISVKNVVGNVLQRLQSPTRAPPHLRCPECLRLRERHFSSTYPTSNLPSVFNIKKVKKKKIPRNLTEIIEVKPESGITERTRSVGKLNAKDVEKCLSSYLITKAEPPDPTISNINLDPLSAFTATNTFLAENASHSDIPFEEQVTHDAIDDEHILLNSAPVVQLTIPTDKDLIDIPEIEEAAVVPLKVHPTSKGSKKDASKRNRKSQEQEGNMLAKARREEMERQGRQVGLNRSLVAYLEMCVFTGAVNRGLNTLNFYRARKSPPNPKVTDIAAYNTLLRGFANQGNTMKVRELMKIIQDDGIKPNAQSYAALLEVLGRNSLTNRNTQSIRKVLSEMQIAGHDIQDLFNKAVLEKDEREVIVAAIRRVNPSFTPEVRPPNMDYVCPLLVDLNVIGDHVTSQAEGIAGISLEKLEEMAKKQLELEVRGSLTVKSVEHKDSTDNIHHFRKLLEQTEEEWKVAIDEALKRNMSTLLGHSATKHQTKRVIGLHPFLKSIPHDDYIHIIQQEIRKLAEGSETYSPSVTQLHRELGVAVLNRWQVRQKERTGVLDKVGELYKLYLNMYLRPEETKGAANPRQMWQSLLYDREYSGPHVDIAEKVWPNSVLSSVGRFLYGIIMRDVKINVNVMKSNAKIQQVPAFYSIFRMQGMTLREEIKPHPVLVKLHHAACRDTLTFDATLVPMLCPPLPWASIRTGGYLLSPAKIVRLPFQAHQQKVRLETCPPEDLYPSLDSLNQLGAVPWKINQKVLDTIITVFNAKGDEDLGVPSPPSECPPPPQILPNMEKVEKFKAHKERLALKRRKAEMYSLWCDALYRLSLADHFRNDVFWFPHNMDFRGRVYPCPPHLNHLGADLARSILVFAKGKPLGPEGLDWLKLHLVNLTGLKKRDSVAQRLIYANEIMDDILDSADNPLTGRKWWATSEEPWQTLACAIEIAAAVRNEGGPEAYVSYFPVHQDGSCNGLQHYAALGRDRAGAESVNLAPSEEPQDVYSGVATLVEKLRYRDAMNGVKIAQVLEGHVKRKVIKQTVMTTVYGVTRYGARLQIAKQLKDIPDFPKEFLWPASLYLVGRTFDSLQEMFTSTKEIQDWFTECARLISQVCGQNVEWVTPLGLPVVQPYFRASKKSYVDLSNPLKLPEHGQIYDLFERPNVMKQKNAFPPNFIHSLDSSHMMLTSVHCERAGLSFVSVHDCYWTHPATVQIMNRICREQFVALHSQPILEDLSQFLVNKYSFKDSEFSGGWSILDASKRRLNQILEAVPEKGSFDLSSVLKSVYFFS